jgi:hypothetical protein
VGSYGDAWNRAGQDGDEDFQPPKGGYEVEVRKVDVFAGGDGREWCKVLFRIVDGDLTGSVFQMFGPAGDHNPVGFGITKDALLMLGLPHDLQITELEDLAHAAGELTGTRAQVGVSYNAKGYMQVKVRSSQTGRSDIPPASIPGIETRTASSATTPSSAVGDDDIPF